MALWVILHVVAPKRRRRRWQVSRSRAAAPNGALGIDPFPVRLGIFPFPPQTAKSFRFASFGENRFR
jgi:hypothetical protein